MKNTNDFFDSHVFFIAVHLISEKQNKTKQNKQQKSKQNKTMGFHFCTKTMNIFGNLTRPLYPLATERSGYVIVIFLWNSL